MNIATFKHAAQSNNTDESHSNILIQQTIEAISTVIFNKELKVKILLAAILAKGHILLEDVPGVGKTTLAHATAIAMGLGFGRIQFTSDLLPGDITGFSIYQRETGQHVYKPGPIFTELLLADEINRASSKTQSALLQAMEEGVVTVDGNTYPLKKPFIVIGTQNPKHHIGTNDLPESQLDRFLISMSLGYPEASAEIQMLTGDNPRNNLAAIKAAIQAHELIDLQNQVIGVHVSDGCAKYAVKVAHMTRSHEELIEGLSPRAVIGWISMAKSIAFIKGRNHVLPDDLKEIFPYVAAHRLNWNGQSFQENLASRVDRNRHWINTIATE